ncbi:hypothetical protein PVAND_010662 [Polypedilum vanderplanki]|uniref:Protein Wnt n=1 Tax=Polypedilum vanderplanki TaxID=319348 RepID=A0A9J6CI08_POLVA|nr:hypothetical protein PVAND_010662 [Polypedilum vanderplanki]
MSHNKLLWITLCSIVWFIQSIHGLQGVPTWMCLGIKSPFIEFTAEFEMLSNMTVSLNLTDKSPDSRHRKNGLHNLGNFINPIGTANRDDKTMGFKGINNTTFSIQSDLLETKDSRKHQEQHLYELQQQQIQELQQHNLNKSATNKILMDIIKPIVTDSHKSDEDNKSSTVSGTSSEGIDHPTIQIIANANNHYEQMNSYMDDSRKVIMPLALKTTLIERDRPVPSPTPLPKPQTNIEDLKKHLLMLQNYSEVDKSFQSKFVVFKKQTSTAAPTTTSTTTPSTPFPTKAPQTTTTMPFPMTVGTMYRTKPSINIPNVQNSQILRDVSYPYTRIERVTVVPQVFLQNDQQQPETEEERQQHTNAERRKNRKNEKKAKRDKKKNRNGKQAASNVIPTTIVLPTAIPLRPIRREQQRQRQMRSQNGSQMFISTTTVSSAPYIINLSDSKPLVDSNSQKLSRTIRSKGNRRRNQNKMQRDALIIDSSNGVVAIKNETSEKIDINPKHCYDVSGMSKGQQKLCEQFTSIMPAISRGARAAIQECQHQFQHRRWNCSTVDDDSVFGPVSAIGSPEMAFVYAMASAAVTSFIARACRDGQLASCGCSRSARPKQLHEDWTWGGCGDDLEFGYKFSQNFIDIREKERKRGARGLISKIPEHLGNDTAADNTTITSTTTMSPEEQIKADEMLKLQQKITQEILNSNLKEKEMNELQEKINKEILNSKIFNVNADENIGRKKNRFKTASAKARALMNLHNNEAGRRAILKKHKVHCTCHGISGSCSLITCWQQLSSIREIGDHLREQYEQATQVKMNKRGRLQVKDSRYKVPTALDLVYLDESPDWCRANKQLQWAGTHGRKCNRTSTGLDSCSILCCGRGYNTKKIVLYERCNCKFQWCCNVRCETCKRVIQEYTCK